MKDKENMQEVYEKLNERNQEIMFLMAKGMEVAQNEKSETKVLQKTSL